MTIWFKKMVQLKQKRKTESQGEREADESIAHLQKLMIFSWDVCSSGVTKALFLDKYPPYKKEPK